MNELISNVGSGAATAHTPGRELHFGGIDQQMNQRERGDHQMRPESDDRAGDKKSSEQNGAKIVNEPVQKIRGGPAAQLCVDEPARLKNKIGYQVAQVNGQESS
jgi:hypothetical protein